MRAYEHSTIAQAHLFGVPGSVWLYLAYILGVAAAFMTATYMTRMMIYPFHGPNRTGEPERQHLREAPWIMTGPLVVLGVLSAVGGLLNLPHVFTHQEGALARWLEPVVGNAQRYVAGGEAPEVSASTEYVLIGAAVAIAAAGMLYAFARLKPERLVPKAQAPEEQGIERVLANKYYVDEGYDRAVVEPTVGFSRNVLWRGVDVGIIDGLLVNGSAWVARLVGRTGSALQTGHVGTYAWVLLVGVIAVLGAFTIR
jgi:NADH-quinone oxidoreductase subunit L